MMTHLYGTRFIRSYGETPDELGVWAMTLEDLAPAQIEFGFRRLTRLMPDKPGGTVWPPNPVEFRRCCVIDYADYGLPCAVSAWVDATRAAEQAAYLDHHYWIHPAVAAAAHAVGWKSITDGDRAAFNGAYFSILVRISNGEEIHKTRRGLEHPQRRQQENTAC